MSILRATAVQSQPTHDPLVHALSQVALFHGLTQLQLERLAADAERLIFHAGETITTAGTAADAAFLIVGGPSVHVPNGQDGSPGHAIVPGSIIGEMAMLIEHTFGATVVARGPVRVLRITRAAVQAHMMDDPSLAEHLVQQMAQRLVQASAELRRVDDALQSALDANAAHDHAAAANYAGAPRGHAVHHATPRPAVRH